MALNLKRKRGKDTRPRKSPKLVEESFGLGVNTNTPDESASEKEDGDDVMEDGEEGEDEWGGIDVPSQSPPIEAVDEYEHRVGTKPKKPPTGEELRVIRDATDLFRSSSFKLQIDALLPNVRPKASRVAPLERFLLSLHSFLTELPSVSPQHPLEAARVLLKKGVAVPYSLPLPTEETNWKVAFERPSDITLVGSWATKVSVKARDGAAFGVDLAVEMPDSLFQEKDYLNGRFFHKRAFYLATIAAAVQRPKGGLGVDVAYQSLSDDPRLTKLVLIPHKDDSPNDFTKLNAHVCITPVMSSRSPIPLTRLSPTHANIRISSTNGSRLADEAEASGKHTPTPLYNTALLTALSPRAELLATHALKQDTPGFGDALTLLRVWANQRGYGGGARVCVRGFEAKGAWWSALLGLLVSGEERVSGKSKGGRKALGRGLSSYQLFRAALDFLGKYEFEKERVFVRTKEGHRFTPEDYEGLHGAVFVDSSSLVNLLAGVPLGSLELLRHDALKTLEALDYASISGDPFTEVFLKEQRDLSTRFDTVLRVDMSFAKPRNSSLQTSFDTGSPANALMASLCSLLRQGLGDRTQAVTVLHSPPGPRPLSQALPSNPDIIHIGLIHNSSNAFRLVDHGPAADEADQGIIERFRELWGDKAELRRFKDGRIVESVVWDVKTADERAHIPAMVVRHILQRHFGIGNDAVWTCQSSFDAVLRLPETISKMYTEAKVPVGFKSAVSAFDGLVKHVKAVDDDLPLAVSNISPVSELLRYTSVFSPVPLTPAFAAAMPPNARYLAPIEIIIEFEKSSKWPDDLRAIQKIKLAFFDRVAAVLMSSIDGLKATVVVGDGVSASEILDQARLELVTPEGWAFSARIWHDREATLLGRMLDTKARLMPHIAPMPGDNKKGKDQQEAAEALEVYTRRFIHGPRHHRAIAALCHRYSAYAGTVRLVKRWLASHWLLGAHISEEVVEILCASLFIGDGRHTDDEKPDERASVPGSKERGFAVVVGFLKEWKWEDGLFVPLYAGAEAPEVDAEKAPVAVGHKPIWAVSTELDKVGNMWTSLGPDDVVARRVRALAKATWDCLQGLEGGSVDIQSMFIHPTEDYDFIVQLDVAVLPRYFHNIAVDPTILTRRGKYANLPPDETNLVVLPGFDPASLFSRDLQRVYSDTFRIFHDPFGGDRFGMVWEPRLKEARPFRVLGGFSSVPLQKENEKAKDKGLVVLNEASILSEIQRLGKGIVKEITVNT